MTVLERVDCPQDLKGLSPAELNQLAAEIRTYLIEVVSKNGGHLAPNLGVVELTIALHCAFHFPQDKLIFDVGHQCYTHKILTGRKKDLLTLRQYQGLSGFPKPKESPYDPCITGHSSTSVSLGLGMAEGMRLRNERNYVVSVLGDGALTGGMVYEAMNHGGGLETPFIVVLNDNQMSISRNVGSLAGHLARLRTSPRYTRSKRRVKDFLQRLPVVGKPMTTLFRRWKNSLKYFLLPGVFFEEMGFTYLGPVDGHNIPDMLSIFQQAKKVARPVVVHVLTQKGRGYAPAEEKPNLFHGTGPFDIASGKPLQNPGKSYTCCFSQFMVERGTQEKRLTAITAAMPDGTGLMDFADAYPARFFDVGIAEEHAFTFAAGLAQAGMRPVVAIYATFLQRAYDQLLHDICLPNLPVVLAIDRAGLVGADGETHQGIYDIALLRSIPNLTVAMPASGELLTAMLDQALQQKGPVALRYPKGKVPQGIPMPDLAWGKGAWLRRQGEIAVLALGPMVEVAWAAANALQRQGIEIAVADLRFIKPLDDQLLQQAATYRHIFLLEEGVLAGSCASGCLEYWQQHGLSPKTTILTLPDAFIPHGTVGQLRQQYGLTASALQEKILQLLEAEKTASIKR